MSDAPIQRRLTSLVSCSSTQLVVAELLEREPSIAHVVRCELQTAGMGRMRRTWENPPGAALLLSVGMRDAGSTELLDGLVRRIVGALEQQLAASFELAPDLLAWSAPNDLVDAATGAKVAGILVDARSVADQIEELRVGIGVNVCGGAWTTGADGREVTTLEAVAGRRIDAAAQHLDAAALAIAARVLELIKR